MQQGVFTENANRISKRLKFRFQQPKRLLLVDTEDRRRLVQTGIDRRKFLGRNDRNPDRTSASRPRRKKHRWLRHGIGRLRFRRLRKRVGAFARGRWRPLIGANRHWVGRHTLLSGGTVGPGDNAPRAIKPKIWSARPPAEISIPKKLPISSIHSGQ